VIGATLMLSGAAIFAGKLIRPNSDYSSLRVGKEEAAIGGALLIAGLISVYLALTDVALLSHFLYGP
jgi:uncharacterized membrane protein YgdD (TMEM256/DUF423 family)